MHSLVMLAALAASGAVAAPDRDIGVDGFVASVEEYMAERERDGFSGAVLVARGGVPVYEAAFGDADREAGRSNRIETAFNIGSMNKMFTALVIGKLVEDGELDWHDKVGRFLPEWPVARVRDEVTIADLLSHQSGLGMFWGPDFDRVRGSLDSVTDFAALFDAEEPALIPGARFRYSNNGYVLLGLIVERVTGEDYYTLVHRLVYEPAGMTASGHFRRDSISRCCATGYLGDGRANTDTLSLRGSPAGGGYSTMHDMLRFALALQEGRIVSHRTLATMLQSHATMGTQASYGYGFGVFVTDGVRHWGHSGGAPGIGAELVVFPDTGYVLVVAANQDGLAPQVSAALRRLILGAGI